MNMNTMKMVNARIFHATPLVPAVDVYLNDKLIQKGLNYKQSTNYLPLMKGMYNVKLYNANTGDLLLNQTLNINDNKYITIVALSDNNKVGLLSLPDKSQVDQAFEMYDGMMDDSFMDDTMYNNNIPMMADLYNLPSMTQRQKNTNRKELVELEDAYVRFVHLSPNAPSVDITTANNLKLFTDVIYKEATDYLAVEPGTYTLLVKPFNTDTVVLRLPNVNLKPNDVVTIYAVGLVGGTPKLEAVILEDGIRK